MQLPTSQKQPTINDTSELESSESTEKKKVRQSSSTVHVSKEEKSVATTKPKTPPRSVRISD